MTMNSRELSVQDVAAQERMCCKLQYPPMSKRATRSLGCKRAVHFITHKRECLPDTERLVKEVLVQYFCESWTDWEVPLR